MQILRDRESVARVTDSDLRALLDHCLLALADFDDHELDELVRFVIFEVGDSMADLDRAAGIPVMTWAYELIEEHDGWFEIVYVLGDDGFGVEVFVPKQSGVNPELLAWCKEHTNV